MSEGGPRWARRWPTGLVVACATLGPLGRKLPAPGTWGSMAGMIYFALVFPGSLGVVGTNLLNAIGVFFAVVFCGEAELRMGRRDPGEVVLDEFVAIPLVYLGWPSLVAAAPGWVVLLAGFGLFRLFDILKPLGIRKLQDLPGGWGVVADDVAAALVACAALHAARWVWLSFVA